ncbi:MAG TPA: c-type cytochrome [Bryobacteraceae bacterium]|nr:c-type cytochrome [Bryobacteraceae bacterium]
MKALIGLGLLFAIAAFPQAGQSQRDSSLDRRLQRGREFLGLGAPPDAAAAARGQKLFATSCSFCHGANATGAEGPNLVRSSLVLHDEKGETIGPVIQHGRPDKGMPAFANFTPEQLYDIAEFLHDRVYQAVNRYGYQIGNIVTGNPAAGQAFLAQHCETCHSASGDLAHIGSKYQPADLQALFLYPGTQLHLPISVDIETANGRHIDGTLVSQDDFTIVLKETSGRISSWQTDQIKFQLSDPLAPHLQLLPQYTDADMHNILAYLVTLK